MAGVCDLCENTLTLGLWWRAAQLPASGHKGAGGSGALLIPGLIRRSTRRADGKEVAGCGDRSLAS